ncbi:hypothetical protein [Rhizobium sp. MHM7A]|uniref:hypothetical protein n=1 Tax=Rhizobium sp. MHM7A TaxID=2583233 RepID=UPI00110706FC|nr:hypothetical protein [Rhizobium sp. MHM7A]TLX16430.1 hypothetical protein FFR93_03595 [Rhizobium sp. MHM7A]
MLQIRDGAFESNSSSSHSLVLGRDDILTKSFSQEVLRAGVLELSIGNTDFQDWFRYYRPESIVKYIIGSYVDVFYIEGLNWDDDEINMIPHLVKGIPQIGKLAEFVKSEYGVEIRLECKPRDVELLETYDSLSFDKILDHRKSLRSLFGSEFSYIETNPENSLHDDWINTDMGRAMSYSEKRMPQERTR